MPIRSSLTTICCTEHTIAITVSIRTYRATLCIRGWAVARVRWLAGVHRRRESSPMMLRWPFLSGATTTWFLLLSSFKQCKQIILGASESPTPVITGGEDHSQSTLIWSVPAWQLTGP
jgi:hypothetical protein